MKGIGVTLFVNWFVKPFSMAFLAWFFIRGVCQYLPADQIDSYVAGLILLAAAPCTAMVFVWSRLTNGDPLFTLSQVALNDAIMVFAFAPLVAFLLGISAITVPWDTLLTSVVLYIADSSHLPSSGESHCWRKGRHILMPRWRRLVRGRFRRYCSRWCCFLPSRVKPSLSSR